MATLKECAQRIGSGVVYRPHPSAPAEDGEIVRVTDFHVFVQYVGDRTPKATRAEDLTFLATFRPCWRSECRATCYYPSVCSVRGNKASS